MSPRTAARPAWFLPGVTAGHVSPRSWPCPRVSATVELTPPDTGLQNMPDRLATVGGALDVSSAPGEGTTVTGTIPPVREAMG